VAQDANALAIYLKGSNSSLLNNGLRVEQVVDADGLGYVDFRVDGAGVGFDYDNSGTTDRVELQAANGDQVTLTRVGDYFRWTVLPDDLRGPLTAPGSSFDVVCQIVVTRTAAGSTVSNAPSRWASRDFTVTVERKIGFSPDQIAGLVLWLDAYSVSEAAGVAVGTWDDKSIFDRDATQATAGFKPLRQTDGTGRPYLDFDGTDDAMATTWAAFTAPCTVLIAASVSTFAAGRGLVQFGGLNGGRIIVSAANLVGASGADVANTTLPALDTAFVATMSKAASGAVTIRKGLGAAVSNASVLAVTAGTCGIGDTVVDAAADFQLYEVVAFDSVLSTENEARVQRYLMKKWSAGG